MAVAACPLCGMRAAMGLGHACFRPRPIAPARPTIALPKGGR